MSAPEGTRPWRKSWRKRWREESSFRDLSPIAKLVVVWVEDNADDDGRARATVRQHAAMFGGKHHTQRVSPMQVWRAWKEAEAAGLILVDAGQGSTPERYGSPSTLTRVNFSRYQESNEPSVTGTVTGTLAEPLLSSRGMQRTDQEDDRRRLSSTSQPPADEQAESKHQKPPRQFRLVTPAEPPSFGRHFAVVERVLIAIDRPAYRLSDVDRKLVTNAARRSEPPEYVAALVHFAFKKRKVSTVAQALSKKIRDSLTEEEQRYVHGSAVVWGRSEDARGREGVGGTGGGDGGARQDDPPDAGRLPRVREDDAPPLGPVRALGGKARSLQDYLGAEYGDEPRARGEARALGGPGPTAGTVGERASLTVHRDPEEPTH